MAQLKHGAVHNPINGRERRICATHSSLCLFLDDVGFSEDVGTGTLGTSDSDLIADR
jgi:hypothetical protein